jgi:hypothetical protein
MKPIAEIEAIVELSHAYHLNKKDRFVQRIKMEAVLLHVLESLGYDELVRTYRNYRDLSL